MTASHHTTLRTVNLGFPTSFTMTLPVFWLNSERSVKCGVFNADENYSELFLLRRKLSSALTQRPIVICKHTSPSKSCRSTMTAGFNRTCRHPRRELVATHLAHSYQAAGLLIFHHELLLPWNHRNGSLKTWIYPLDLGNDASCHLNIHHTDISHFA